MIKKDFEYIKYLTCLLYYKINTIGNVNAYVTDYFENISNDHRVIDATEKINFFAVEGGKSNKITRRRKKLRRNTKNNKRILHSLKRSVH